MKKLIFLLSFFVLSIFGKSQTITYSGYVSYYNPKTLIPDSVIWICSSHTKAAGREAGFHSTGNRPNLSKDYAHSGYDIGHNCDASDENRSKEDEYNSFDFANTFPQLPQLNRITWLALENFCRKISPVKVKVSWSDIKCKIGADSVTVPLFCIKEIWYQGKYEKYVFPNQDTVIKHDFTYYKLK